jgi:hypothetical protein
MIKERLKKDNLNNYTYSIFIPDLTEMKFENGRIDYNPKSQKVEKTSIDIYLWTLDFIYNLKQYKKVEEILKNHYKIKDHLISNFIHHFAHLHAVNYNKSKVFFRKIIKQFIKELDGKGPLWNIKIYIASIWLDFEEREILKNVILRRIKSSDFEFLEQRELVDHFWPPDKAAYSLLEFDYKAKPGKKDNYGTDTQIQVDKIIGLFNIIFLLFKFGSIFFPRIEKKNSLLLINSGNVTSYHSTFFREKKIYALNNQDLQDLREFVKIILKPTIREAFTSKGGKLTHIIIAYQRYYNAFINIESRESQITYLISCLEAMLSEGGGELSRRLKKRAALILKVFKYQPIIVNNVIHEAYGIRSKYSHGTASKISLGYKKRLLELSNKIFDYARILLQIEIQLYPIINKKDFLELIDRALLDDAQMIELEEILLVNCKIFK